MHKLINGNPSWQAAQDIAMTFQLIWLELGMDAKVDMGDGKVQLKEKNLCGTTACHGGWFTYFSMKRIPSWGYVNYNTGGDKMAQHLGFMDGDDLADWAEENTKLWGNDFGSYIFCDENAFGSCSLDKPITLKDIYKHWYKVAERLYKLQYDAKNELQVGAKK
jgi:hypothetical protein